MDTDCRYAWTLAAVSALFAGGCNSNWSDGVPELNAPSEARAEAAKPAGQSARPGSAARPIESAVDAALSSKVERALGAEPDLHGSSIAVRSRQGIVTLSGVTSDPKRRSMAAQVALSIDGVELVRNEIALAQAT
jgi:osmotically-inducible protein OsmY